jgi:hypothetical protein
MDANTLREKQEEARRARDAEVRALTPGERMERAFRLFILGRDWGRHG